MIHLLDDKKQYQTIKFINQDPFQLDLEDKNKRDNVNHINTILQKIPTSFLEFLILIKDALRWSKILNGLIEEHLIFLSPNHFLRGTINGDCGSLEPF